MKSYLFDSLLNSLQSSIFVYFSYGVSISLHTPLYIGGVDSRHMCRCRQYTPSNPKCI